MSGDWCGRSPGEAGPVAPEPASADVRLLVEGPAQLDDRAAARRDRRAGGRPHQPFATVQGVAQKNSAGGGRAHTLNGRQRATEVERVGLRLQLRKQQADAETLV